jgi:hypothetical protein
VVPGATGRTGGAGEHRTGTVLQTLTSARGTFSNWVGVFVDLSGDDEVDWDEIAAIIEAAYCVVAPKELIAQREPR